MGRIVTTVRVRNLLEQVHAVVDNIHHRFVAQATLVV